MKGIIFILGFISCFFFSCLGAHSSYFNLSFANPNSTHTVVLIVREDEKYNGYGYLYYYYKDGTSQRIQAATIQTLTSSSLYQFKATEHDEKTNIVFTLAIDGIGSNTVIFQYSHGLYGIANGLFCLYGPCQDYRVSFDPLSGKNYIVVEKTAIKS